MKIIYLKRVINIIQIPVYEMLKINDKDIPPFNRAVAFYVINKCSFSGLTESSSFSRQASISNFSYRGIEKIPGYQEIISNWHISNYSYDYIMEQDKKDKKVFYYLDPPYDIKDNLYGKSGAMHKGFDHDKFALDCMQYDAEIALSYNSNQLIILIRIRQAYENCCSFSRLASYRNSAPMCFNDCLAHT